MSAIEKDATMATHSEIASDHSDRPEQQEHKNRLELVHADGEPILSRSFGEK
jgi:hypothetical protein